MIKLQPTSEVGAFHDTKRKSGAGVLLVDSDTSSVLLGLRGRICNYPNTWAPFGGMVEPGEDPHDAAFRELEEEANVSIPVALGGLLFYVNENPDGFKFYTYLVIQSGRPEVRIDEEESMGYAWFGFDKLPKNLHPGFQQLVEHGGWHMLCAQFGLPT